MWIHAQYLLRRGVLLTAAFGLVLVGLSMLSLFAFRFVVVDARETLRELVTHLPPALRALAGDPDEFTTPAGFLNIKLYPIIGLLMGVYTILIGSGLLATDEESGRLDLLAAYPRRRASLYWGRVLAMCLSLATVLGCCIAAISLATLIVGFDISFKQLLVAFGSLFFYTSVFGGVAVFLSQYLPSRWHAASLAGLFFLLCLVVEAFAPTVPWLQVVEKFLPVHFHPRDHLDRFQPMNLLVLSSLTVASFFGGYLLFERRDIRVIGEGTFDGKRTLVTSLVFLSVYALVVGLPSLSFPLPKPTTPSIAFDNSMKAAHRQDWPSFVASLSEHSRERTVGLLAVLGAMVVDSDAMKLMNGPAAESSGPTIPPEIDVKGLPQMQTLIRQAMLLVDRDKLPKQVTNPWLLLAGYTISEDQIQQAADAVTDRDRFLVRMIEAISKVYRIPEARLSDIETKAEVAQATLGLSDGRKLPTSFRRVGDRWFWDFDPLSAKGLKNNK